ncbi:hypothetical protein ACH5RR_029445 [Cinchona calisaya]|uniref:Protein JASON n=1 Tax=Cinchona calisaya TaxID=153742 RepID=A0ABD2YRN3_9GENT
MKCYSSAWLRIPSSSSETEAASAWGAAQFDDSKRRRPRRIEIGFLGLERFFTTAMVAAMGCLFGCFGVKDSTASSNSDSSSSTPAVKMGAVTRKRNPLSSSLLSEDNDGMPTKANNDQDLGIPKPELGFSLKELKDEAKFLKACGTLPETPTEIRKVSEKFQDSSTQKGEQEGPKFRSWFTDTPFEKLNLETECNQPPTPIEDHEQWVKVSHSAEHTPSSCMTNGKIAERASSSSNEGYETKNDRSMKRIVSPSNSHTCSSATPGDISPSLAGKNKSVHFDFDADMSSVSSKRYPSGTSAHNSKQSASAINSSTAKSSPYPTPLKLSDEMQTPGTVFPAHLDAMGQGKNTRVRSQYAYSVRNPAENFSLWKEMKNEDTNCENLHNHTRESREQNDEVTLISEVAIGETSVAKALNVEASLFSWLSAPLPKSDGNIGHSGPENFCCGRSPGDRPILGMVASHWNDDGPSQILPKWWDRNGIPNSTNKYKEDQKVSWHATPFEERLEKALSEETFISQRNQTSRTPPPDFSATDESDTALSQLQPSNLFKSVVSF